MRLAIVTTHPIQYYAAVFRLLTERRKLDIKVFYTWGEASENKFDPGFGREINWDVPLLEGYNYQLIKNTSTSPGSHHFKGIVNPGLIAGIEEFRPDAILVYGWAYHSHLKVIRYFRNRLPVYFRGDSTLLDARKGFKGLLRSVFLKWVYRYVDYAFYVGTNNKAYFKKYGLKERQLIFAPHAVDNTRFNIRRNDEVKRLKQDLRIHETDTVILFAGKFETKKSPLVLLEAFLTLHIPGTQLLFVGNGVLEDSLKARAGENKNVHFLGFQNQTMMPVIYQACDLFCLTSTGPGETWGLAVNEAMACGKAILVSDMVGCAIDLVHNGKNGAIFKAGDVKDLEEKLKQMIHSKSVLADMGRESAGYIKDWSFLHITEALENKLLNEAY